MDEIRAYARAVREERGWTIEDFAGRCGVSVNTIRNLEQRGTASLPMLFIVLGKLGVGLKPEKVRQ